MLMTSPGRLLRRTTKLFVIGGLLLFWYAGVSIAIAAQRTDMVAADAALVLGAAAYGERPSPVFRERINHAIALYQSGQVERIIFSGGVGNRSNSSEAAVARRYAIERGVPADAILLEEQAANTLESMQNVRPLLAAEGIESVIIVSTPFHMRRALFLAGQLDVPVYASPTRTTRWVSGGLRNYFYTREMIAFLHYRFVWPVSSVLG